MLQNMKDLRVKSGLLSILVHFVLFLFLVVSLSWNSREPEPVMMKVMALYGAQSALLTMA